MKRSIPLPIIITKEDNWFVASCPVLDVATQGKTEKEVKANMVDLVNEYLKDPDTPKPTLKTMMSVSVSLTSIPISLPEVVHGRASSAIKA